MTRRSLLGIVVEVGGTAVVVLLIWWYFGNSDSPYFPSFSVIGSQFSLDWDWQGIESNLVPSLVNLGAGMLIASTLGVALGTLVGLWRPAYELLAPLFTFFRALPPVALLPVFIVILGLDAEMKIAFIAFGALWPTLLNTTDGVRAVDAVKQDMFTVSRMTFRRRLFQLILPAASPAIFAGIRTTLQFSLALMIISEISAATEGLGYTIMDAQATFNLPRMWAAMVVIGIVGYLSSLLLTTIEKQVLTWHRGERGYHVAA